VVAAGTVAGRIARDGELEMTKRLLAFLGLSLVTAAAALAQTVTHAEDFQSYGTQANPPGWVDNAVGKPKTTPSGLFKTWPDPKNSGNIVYGTKKASGNDDSNARSGSFSTLTTKTFNGTSQFEYRGRFFRTRKDARLGLTVFSGYPVKDSYYLIGLAPSPSRRRTSADGIEQSTPATNENDDDDGEDHDDDDDHDRSVTMSAIAFGAGKLTGTPISTTTIATNKWYRFAIIADSTAAQTRVRARFWVDGTAEPVSYSIDVTDAASGRLSSGHIGVWSAVKGAAYFDDLSAKSGGSDTTAPVISFFESDTALEENWIFDHDAAPEVRVTDDSSGVGTVTIKLDGTAYVSKTPITTERGHQLDVDAVDQAGNAAHATIHFAIDKSFPVVAISNGNAAIADGAVFSADVRPVVTISDLSPVASTITLDGAAFVAGAVVGAEGKHTLAARATDAVGHTTAATIAFTIDRSDPVITITNNGAPLTDGAVFSADVKPVVTITDLSLRTSSVTLDGAPFVNGTVVSTEGKHTIAAQATDGASHSKSVTVSFTIDKAGPSITITNNGAAIVEGAVFAGDVRPVVTINDPTLSSSSVTLDGVAFVAGTVVSAEGKHTLAAQATDSAGHTNSVTVPFTIDRTDPVVTITNNGAALADGVVFGGDVKPVVTVDDATLVSLTITLDGRPFVAGSTVTAEAKHTLSITATDGAGHTKSMTRSFMIDRTDPVITITNNGVPLVDGTTFAVDVKPVVTIEDTTLTTSAVTLDGAPFIAGTVVSGGGSHTIAATATDGAGHTKSVTVSFTIDKSGPALTITSNHDGDVVTDAALVVTGSAGDATSVKANGIEATLSGGGYTSAPLSLVEGSNTLTVTGLDAAGNASSVSITVVLDTRAPQLEVIAPAPGACLNIASMELRGTVSDAHRKDVTVQLGGASVTATIDNAGAWTATLSNLPEGKAIFLITATDTLGHATTLTRSISVDRTAPTIEINESGAPFTATLVSRSVALDVRVSDTDVKPALVVTLENNTPYVAGTTISAEGAHTLDAIATDCAGLKSEKKLKFTIDKTAPAISGFVPAEAATIGTSPSSIHAAVNEAATITITGTSVSARANAAGAFDLTGLTLIQGLNRFTLHAVDDAGNAADVPYSFTLRTTLPVIDILDNGVTIAGNALFNRAVTPTIRVNVSDATATATLDGQPFTSGTTISTEGTHTLSATVTDPASHSASSNVTFTIDKTAPVIKINTPVSGQRIDGDHTTVSGNAGDAVALTVNGTSITPAPGGAFATTVALDLGENLIVASGHDLAGNNAGDQLTVTRNDAGTGIVLTSPVEGSTTNRKTTVVSGRILTPANAASLSLEGATLLSPGTSGPKTTGAIHVAFDPTGSFTIADFPLFEGPNAITATLTSTNGKTTAAIVNVNDDLTPPTVRVLAGNQPLDEGARFPSTVSLSADTSEGAVELRVDGAVVTAPFSVSATGAHTAIATATDAAGNQSRIRRSFAIGAQSASGCTLSGFDPASGAVVAAQSVTIAGLSGGAAGVKINGVPARVSNGSFSGTAELTREGANAISIVCTDAAGATIGNPAALNLLRATNAPSITITTPTELAILATGTIAVGGTVSDAVSVDVNGANAVVNSTSSGSTFTANVTLTAGLNVLVARARNGAGRASSASRRVVYLKDAPAISVNWPNDGFSTGAATVDIGGTYANLDPSTIAASLGGTLESHVFSDTSGSFTLHGVPLTAGPQAVVVTGHDATARTASATLKLTRDASGASIAISSPANNSYISSSTVAVSGTFSAVSGSQVDVAGSAATLSGSTFSGSATLSATDLTPVVARLTQPDGSSAIANAYVTRLASAPTVRKVFPSADATAVDPGVIVLVSFSAPMDRASLIDGFVLLDGSGAPVSGQRRLDRDVFSFAPATTLNAGERYTAVVKTSAQDLAGNAVVGEVRSSFTISASAPPTAPVVDAIASPVCSGTIAIAGSAPAGSRLEINIGGIPQFTTADAAGRFSTQLTIPSQSGFRVARIRVLGADGSYSPSAEAPFQIDCAGPTVVGARYDRNANAIAVTFSKPIDFPTVAAAIALKLGDGAAVTSSIAAGASPSAIVITPGTPDPRAATLVLTIAATIKDTTGRTLAAPFSQTFTVGTTQSGPSNGSGFLSGQVFDATNGRPLAGVNIAIAPSALTIVTDVNGQYASAVDEGAYTIHASASGYTDVWRQVVVPAGSGIVPIDIRLIARGTSLQHGGDDSITRKATLTTAAGTLPPGTTLTITSVGSQSLAGLLPLGWSPLAAAEVRATWPGTPATATAQLSFDLPAAATTSGRSFAAVEYDTTRDEWRVLQAVVALSGYSASFTINVPPSLASFALVYPDALAGLAAPPAPTAGGVLAGVHDPCATQTCPTLVAQSFPLNPQIVLPSGRTVATLNIDGNNNPYPSGTAVQAFVNEELRLVDGSTDVAQPFSTDLILYRSLAGTTSAADFHLAPSARAANVPLQVGFDHIQILPYPGRLDRGTLVGAAGGPIPSDDRVQVDIPTGAAPSAIHATATSITDLSQFNIAGFTTVAGFTLALSDVGQAILPVQLLKPANATFTIDAVNASAQLIVVEVAAGTPYGRIFRMVAATSAPQSVGATSKVRVATAAIDPAKLPLDGIVRPGQYLLLLAQQPIAFAFGAVRLGVSGGYVNSAQVTAAPLGITDVSRPTGLFVIPVVAKPATTFTLTPSHPSIGSGAPHGAAAVDAGLPIPIGDLVLTSQPPRLQHVNVITTNGTVDLVTTMNAANVNLSTSIQALFSQSLDSASVTTSSITVADASGKSVAGTTTGSGATLIWTAGAALAPNASYVVTISGSVRGSFGANLGGSQSFAFNTVTRLTNAQIHAEKIHITIPDANGVSTISGDPGAFPTVPPETKAWRALALRRGRAFVTQYQVTSAADGSFTFTIGSASEPVALRDHIDLEILNAADNIAAILPLGPFASADGQAFVAQPEDEVTYTTRDGISIHVPPASFDEPTTLRATRLDTATPFAEVPNFATELNFHRGVQLDFACAPCTAKNRLDLTIPTPPNPDPAKKYLLGWLGESVRGPRVMVVDTLRIEGGSFTTTPLPGSGLVKQSASVSARKGSLEVISGNDVKNALLGANRSGAYNIIDIRVPAGGSLGWAAMNGLQGNYDLFSDQFASLYASHQYLTESRGRIVIPVLAGAKFELSGDDAGSGLQAFKRVYDPVPADGSGGALVVPDPRASDAGPYPLFATPGRVEIVDLQAASPITSVRNFTIRLEGGWATVGNAEPALPNDVEAALLNATTGAFGPSRGSLQVKASLGDRLVLAIGERDVDPQAALQVVFSRPIYTGADADPDAVDQYLHTVIKLMRASKPLAGLPNYRPAPGAHFTVDSEGRRLNIEMPSELERGAFYRLDLTNNLAGASGDGPGLRLGQVREGATTSSPIDMSLYFQVRDVPDPLTSFDIRQDQTTSTGAIRDLSLNGNVLLMSAGSGGILAYDTSNPASLTSGSLPIGYVKAGSSDFWAVASDHHGRVFATGTDGIFGFVQSYRLDDFLGSAGNQKVITAPRSSSIVAWVPGYNSGAGLSTDTVLSDRPEGLPRRLQLAVQDDELPYDGLSKLFAGLGSVGSATTPTDAGRGFKKFNITIGRQNGFEYRTQRITVENVTRGLKWSADATDAADATITDILAQPADQLRIVINRRTYGVVTIFGYGVGVFDLNAVESNDLPNPPTGYKQLSERVRTTRAALNPQCPGQSEDPSAIQDLGFAAEVAVVAQSSAGRLVVYGADVHRGVLDVNVALATPPPPTSGPECDDRAPVGILLKPDVNPRIAALAGLFTAAAGRPPFARFGGVQVYHSADRNYLLVPGYEYGLLVIDTANPPGWLANGSLADMIWIPGAAVAARVIPNTSYATVVDSEGRVLLVDLSKIDERSLSGPNDLFPTVSEALKSGGSYGVGAPDPRIVWTSAPGLVSGSLAPVIDPDTGILFAGQAQGKTTKVVAARDPLLRVMVDSGNGTSVPTNRITPLGVTAVGSSGVFRVEATLPGGITDSVPNMSVAVESERVIGALTEDTPQPLPRAHLRNVALHRVLPDDFALAAKLRSQRGFNHFVSDWIVAVADPRATKDYGWPAGADKAAVGCASCDRPDWLPLDAKDIYSTGHFFHIRPADSLFIGAYAYLGQGQRLESEIGTIPADLARPSDGATALDKMAAHNLPTIGAMTEKVVALNDGEVVESATDLAIKGRGIDFVLQRNYSSAITHMGPFGRNFDSPLFAHVQHLPNGDVVFCDGTGRKDVFAGGSTPPAGVFLEMRTDANGQTVVMYPDNTRLYFDGYGRLAKMTDRNATQMNGSDGNAMQFLYGARGELATVVDPTGRAIRFKSYTTTGSGAFAGCIRSVTDFDNRTVTYTYDEFGRLTNVSGPDPQSANSAKPSTTYIWSPGTTAGSKAGLYQTGQISSEKDGLSRTVWSVVYNSAQPWSASTLTSGGGTWTFSSTDTTATVLDPNAHTTEYGRDGSARIAYAKEPGGSMTSYGYDASGRIATITRPLGDHTVYGYVSPKGDRRSMLNVQTITEHPRTGSPEAAAGMTRTTSMQYGPVNLPTKITAPDGATTQIIRDGRGNPQSITDAVGVTATTTYDEHGMLKTSADPRTGAAQYTYFGGPNGAYLNTITTTSGVITYNVDGRGNAIKVTDASGKNATYGVNKLDQVETENRGTSVSLMSYDATGELTAKKMLAGADANGQPLYRQMTFEVDEVGRLKTRSDNGQTMTFGYDSKGNLTSLLRTSKPPATFGYDGRDRFVSEIVGSQRTTYGYDEDGAIASMTNARGKTTSFHASGFGQSTGDTTPTGVRAIAIHDAAGRPIDTKMVKSTPDGKTLVLQWSKHEYDPMGRLTKETAKLFSATLELPIEGSEPAAATDVVTQTRYDDTAHKTTSIDARGNQTVSETDELGRLVKVTDAVGNTMEYTYDSSGNKGEEILTEVAGDGSREVSKTVFSYDDHGRVVAETNLTDPAHGLATTFRYDEQGNLTEQTDAEGRKTKFEYDLRRRKTKQTDGEGGIATYGYDDADRLTSIKDANGNETKFTYDADGNLATEQRADGATWAYTYDENLNQKTITDPNGTVMTMVYDDADRLTGKQIAKGTNVLGPSQITMTLDDLGRTTATTTDEGVAESFAYDSLGRELSESIQIGAGPKRMVARTFDAAGNVAGLIYPSGLNLAYAIDKLDRIAAIRDAANPAAPIVTYADIGGRMTSKALGNGITDTWHYDSQRRLSEIVSKLTNSVVRDVQYERSPIGNKIAAIRPDLQHKTAWTYNANHWMTSESLRIPLAGTDPHPEEWTTYDIDHALNFRSVARMQQTPGGTVTSSARTSINDRNQYTTFGGETLKYDRNGNLTGRANVNLQYDFENHLRKATLPAGPVLENVYDATGRKVEQRLATPALTATDYVLSGNDVVEEYIDGKLASRYVRGREIDEIARAEISSRGDGTVDRVIYPLQDELQSTERITDANGATVESYQYDGYGRTKVFDSSAARITASRLGWKWLFHGREYESIVDAIDFRARTLWPDLSRFGQEDAAAVHRELSAYEALLGSPALFIDPSGLYEEDVHHYLTRFLAAAAGFNGRGADSVTGVAEKIGYETGALDYDERDAMSNTPQFSQGSLANESNDRLYHFVTPARLAELGEQARTMIGFTWLGEDNTRFRATGEYLHALEDSYSHQADPNQRDFSQTYTTTFGHAFHGKHRDWTWERQALAMSMAMETYTKLRGLCGDYRLANTLKHAPCTGASWSTIKTQVARFVNETPKPSDRFSWEIASAGVPGFPGSSAKITVDGVTADFIKRKIQSLNGLYYLNGRERAEREIQQVKSQY
jgi:YD repeat-containing protein